MKIATRNAIAAALAVALAGMGMPVAALAANGADDVAGTQVVANSEDVIIVERFSYEWADAITLSEIDGKWYRTADQYVNGADYETIKYMVKTNNKGGIDFYVDGSGNAGELFPAPTCAEEYANAHDCNGTLYIGAGITSIGTDEFCHFNEYAKNVNFAEGSKVKEIGPTAFSYGITSVNLENCRSLKVINIGAFWNADCDITVPSSVREAYGDPFNGVTGEIKVEDPENTPVVPSMVYLTAPKLKVIRPGKIKVSWSKPCLITLSDGKSVERTVSFPVRYKVEFMAKGSGKLRETSMTSASSKTLTKLTKGKKYQVRITAYWKSGSKWEHLRTSTYKTVKVK